MRGTAWEKLFSCLLLSLVLAFVLPACGVPGERVPLEKVRPLENPAPSESSEEEPSYAAAEYLPYKVGVRDILDVQVENHPELSGKYIVAKDGTIAVPYSEKRLDVEACTLKEAGERFRDAISPYTLSKPTVVVALSSARSKFFYVLGAVGRRGKFAIGDEVVRLRDAILRAGLFADRPWFRPATRKVYVITPHEETPTYTVVNARNVVLGKLRDNIVIKPGDIVYVPDTMYFKINVALSEIIRETEQISQTTGAEEYYEENFPQGTYRR